jgi:hypothetical protein
VIERDMRSPLMMVWKAPPQALGGLFVNRGPATLVPLGLEDQARFLNRQLSLPVSTISQ